MRRFAPSIRVAFLVCALLGGADSPAGAQSSRTAPLPVTTVARTRLFQKQRDEPQQRPPEAPPASTIPATPPAQPQTQPPVPPPSADPAASIDPVLVQAKQAIEINKRRFLDPTRGHTPWMIMHGVLALRQEYQLMIGNKPVNAIEYITQQNPSYSGSLPLDPLHPKESPWVQAQAHWFQSTVHGGRAQPYVVSYAFEGHTNQFLAILSMSDLPLTQTIVVSDSQKPGVTKTITMADMVRHAQMNVHVGNPNEIAWTLWFLSNYLQPDEKWINKDGHPWSMEQLVTIQTNAPLFRGDQLLAPCGGTHGLFALACACNSYQQKHDKLDGAWLAARQRLDNHIALARRMQNRDGSFSTEYFKNTGWSGEMGPRFKSSGHMLEWLMMALPPEDLKQQWVRSGVMNVANDLVRWGNAELKVTSDTGAMYHALHALVLYRNRMDPKPLIQMVEVSPEQKNPAPGTTTPPLPLPLPMPVPANPAPLNPVPMGQAPLDAGTAPKPPVGNQPETTIRLLNPATNKLSPLGSVRPLLRPITNSKTTDTPPKLGETPAPPPMAEKIGEPKSGEPARIPLVIPPKPLLEKPAPTVKPTPVPSEPKSEGAIVKPLTPNEGEASTVPLFGEAPEDMKAKPAPSGEPPSPTQETPPTPVPSPPVEPPPAEKKPAEPPAAAPLVPPLPEPTPSKSPSSSD